MSMARLNRLEKMVLSLVDHRGCEACKGYPFFAEGLGQAAPPYLTSDNHCRGCGRMAKLIKIRIVRPTPALAGPAA